MNVSLTPELEKKVDEKVESGLYASASEVVREALRLLFQLDELRREDKADMNKRIRLGLAQLERGEAVAGREARRRSKARLTQKMRESA